MEILTTEVSYVKSLECVIELLLKPVRKYHILSDQDIGIVFGQIEVIYKV